MVLLYVAWKGGLPRKFAGFVLLGPIKKRSFNLLCVLESRNKRKNHDLLRLRHYICGRKAKKVTQSAAWRREAYKRQRSKSYLDITRLVLLSFKLTWICFKHNLTLWKTVQDWVEHIWTFPSCQVPRCDWTEPNWRQLIKRRYVSGHTAHNSTSVFPTTNQLAHKH